MFRIKKFFLSTLLLVISLLIPPVASSSTVLKVNLEQMALKSEFIFEGRVLSRETRPSPLDGRPYTYFTFQIIDVLKGAYPNTIIELGFAGGTINSMTLTVSDLQMPEVNESGIYFVESLQQELIHPLYGWSQGHYVIRKLDSTDKAVNAQAKARQALLAAPTVADFKQKVRTIIGGAQ